MWSTMAEEVKVVNDSMMCFSQKCVQERVKKILVLEAVICR